MPKSVGDVRFMIEPFRLTLVEPASLGVKRSGFAGSAGVEVSEESAEGGARSNTRRGRGRMIEGSSDMASEKGDQ